MKTLLRIATIVLLVLVAVPPARAAETPEAAAEKAATAWLAMTDSGKYGESWDAAAKLFRDAVPREKWIEAMNGVRHPLGATKSRKLKSAQATTKLPGAPEGNYVVLQFDASFEHRPSAVETVTPMKEKDGSWKVSGYYIK